MRLESGRKEEALVWALEALSDGTVVSGDSYGRVQVSPLCSFSIYSTLPNHHSNGS